MYMLKYFYFVREVLGFPILVLTDPVITYMNSWVPCP